MVIECRNYLISKLKESGIKTNIHVAMKTLKNSSESHIGAVLFQDEQIKHSDEKVIVIQEGKRQKATKLFERELRFNVIIGEYSHEKTEQIYERFLRVLDKQIEVGDCLIQIDPVRCEWVTAEDSILQSKIAANVEIVMTTYLFQKNKMARITGIEIDRIEKENTWQE